MFSRTIRVPQSKIVDMLLKWNCFVQSVIMDMRRNYFGEECVHFLFQQCIYNCNIYNEYYGNTPQKKNPKAIWSARTAECSRIHRYPSYDHIPVIVSTTLAGTNGIRDTTYQRQHTIHSMGRTHNDISACFEIPCRTSARDTMQNE